MIRVPSILVAVQLLSIFISFPNFAQPISSTEFEKVTLMRWAVHCEADGGSRVTVAVQTGEAASYFSNDTWARAYIDHIRDRSFSYCNEQLKKGQISSVPTAYEVFIEIPLNQPCASDNATSVALEAYNVSSSPSFRNDVPDAIRRLRACELSRAQEHAQFAQQEEQARRNQEQYERQMRAQQEAARRDQQIQLLLSGLMWILGIAAPILALVIYLNKTMKCTSCAKRIGKEAKLCPYCRISTGHSSST